MDTSPPVAENQSRADETTEEQFRRQWQHLLLGAYDFMTGMHHKRYRPLYLAALKGDWESAERFLASDPNALTARITTLSQTALHIAAIEDRSHFVEKLVQLMSSDALAMRDDAGNTALHYCASIGKSVIAARVMVMKNPNLTQIINSEGCTPLHLGAISTRGEQMVRYLSSVTQINEYPAGSFTPSSAALLISMLALSGFYDVALSLIQRRPDLATARTADNLTLLRALALRAEDFPSGTKLGVWESCIYPFVGMDSTPPWELVRSMVEDPVDDHGKEATSPAFKWFRSLFETSIKILVPGVKRIQAIKMRQRCVIELVKVVCTQASNMNFIQACEFFTRTDILNVAIYYGVVEIISISLQYFPDLFWLPVARERNLLQAAIEMRQENVFNLLKDMNMSRSLALQSDGSKNTILHLAAKLAPPRQLSSISGSVLQMQRELQWFKEVEKLMPPMLNRNAQNHEKRTAWEVFTEEHKELVKKGEEWMKGTSNSCMVVATLIATVAFAAAFTVPGGNKEDTGIPFFLWTNSFMVFVVSNSGALFFSTTSLLMFLSILTARYAEEDFLRSLPKRLIIGFASLFFAIAAMMVAFCATLSIVLSERLKWISIPIALLASFPVSMFALLQLPLFVQMLQSTYGSTTFRPQKLW